MERKAKTATVSTDETGDEMIGVLTAISIVSMRMAKKLTLLKRLNFKRKTDCETGKRASP